MFSGRHIKELLGSSEARRRDLQETYGRLPEVSCRRSARCCSMLPEMSLIEMLAAIDLLLLQPLLVRTRLLANILSYFFTNPATITACPFLDGRGCLIYQNRFLGCRTYGLWSPAHYAAIAGRSREAKAHIRQQWRSLGIELPSEVVDFQVAYCRHVKPEGKAPADAELLEIADAVEALSAGFPHWHEVFTGRYFGDLSFLITSLIFGMTGAVQIKFAVVSDIVTAGNRARLDKILAELPDLSDRLA